MAKEKKAAAATTPTPGQGPKKYEVVRQINIGGSNPIRHAGDELTDKEVSPEDLRWLLEFGHIRDTDAPIPPSQAEGLAAFDRLANIAKRIGVLKVEGSEYRFGETKVSGLSEFRKAVSVAELETAIVEAFSR